MSSDGGTIWESRQGSENSKSLLLTFMVDQLTPGKSYKFKVQAHNIHGWGLNSDVLTVVASGIPEVPAPVTVSIENVAVKISWTPPFNNFAPITRYLVTVKQTDGTFTAQTFYCDASQALILA